MNIRSLCLITLLAVGAFAHAQETSPAERPPRHRVGLSLQPRSAAATHSVRGEDVNFRGNGIGAAVGYEFQPTSRLALAFEYTHLDLRIEETQAGNLTVRGSTAAFDTYDLNAKYCFFGDTNFFQQICPGLEVASDGYPLLVPREGNVFELGRVFDVVTGVNVSYRSPISEQVVFRATGGYGVGLRSGASQTFAARANSRYYLRLGGGWDPYANHGFGADIEWFNRAITVREKSSGEASTTKSTDLALRLSYVFSF